MAGGLLETKAMPEHRLLAGLWPTMPASLRRRRSAQAGSTVPKLATLREEENR
ncbi:hypothetical protein N181_29705 [Sinorhizobium fredii USDA 205]|nr:hypothetical protein N181_29705 [Sinorhizobium fredii USDA 205]